MPEETPVEAAEYSGLLRITEVMAKNRATLCDEDGSFPDWIELENLSDEVLSLSGWSISDRPKARRQALPDELLEPGARTVVFCRDFGLSAEETVSLLDPDGNTQDTVFCASAEEDRSLALRPEGVFAETVWATPGEANSADGYDAVCMASARTSPLLISEVMVANSKYSLANGRVCDWVELINIGPDSLNLNGCSLSESLDDPQRWVFPDLVIAGGEKLVLCCDGDRLPSTIHTDGSWSNADSPYDRLLNTGFSLSAERETLFLFGPDGTLLDFLAVHDVPREGSVGRRTGENGFYYFPVPTPGETNGWGARRISTMPVCLTEEGPYDGVDRVQVELQAEGEIRYTLDGTEPDETAALYTAPFIIEKTCVVRACSMESGALRSRPATFSFFLNERHTLPILSLALDDTATFSQMYSFGMKYRMVEANLALYEEGKRFGQDCELSMKGWTSLTLPKKSMGAEFKGSTGGMLHCDIFGNGITDYDALSIRAGQDYNFAFFRNEMFQDLCLEASDELVTQYSKYCVLYINGSYYGIYCLKDDIDEQFYANHRGVSADSVEGFRSPSAMLSDYYNMVQKYTQYPDLLAQDEVYRAFCNEVNVDNLIDWYLFEGYTANTDTQGNLRIYRSSEIGNRWDCVLYDLDWALWYTEGNFKVLFNSIGNVGSEMPKLLQCLIRNADFRDRMLSRYGELVQTVFADDYVLAKMDEYCELLRPELPRDRERWYLTMETWEGRVDLIRDIIRSGYAKKTVDELCRQLRVTPEERVHYFGDM